jgi:NitT/TauT family transport system ATP-binding protein
MTPSPGRIKEIIDVPFPRPRKRNLLFSSQDYLILRTRLLARFSEEMQDDIARRENGLITWSI